MIYIGLDVHKKKTKVATLDDETGEFNKPYDVLTAQLVEHLTQIEGPKCLAMETGTTTHFLARRMESCELDVRLVDARKAHILMTALHQAKTDKLDALGLCFLLAKGMLDTAEVWVPDQTAHELRELVRTRDALMRQSVKLQNQIRKFLCRQGLDCPGADLQGRHATLWLDEIVPKLSKPLAVALSSLRRALAAISAQLDELTDAIEQLAQVHPSIELLQTIPGIGLLLGAIIVAEIGDVTRFDSATKLRGYTGLVPAVSQSGETSHTGPLVRGGDKLLRWALIQAAQNFARSRKTQDLRICANHKAKVFQYGPNPAKVSLARHLTNVIYAMLRDGTEFDPELLRTAQAA